MSQSDAVQRLQIQFAAEGPLKYVSHLDLMRGLGASLQAGGLATGDLARFFPRVRRSRWRRLWRLARPRRLSCWTFS